MINIIIADDQPLIRDGLKVMLDSQEGFRVAAVAGDGREALEMAGQYKPDVLLLDIRMPVVNGVDCLRELKKAYPGIKVIMLTTFNDDEYIMGAIAAGASGYLLKDIETVKLIEAIHDALADKLVMPPSVIARLAEGLTRIESDRKENEALERLGLSEREKEIARMMANGFNNRQIASVLYLSEGTVRNYISGIYVKSGCNDRAEVVSLLKEKGGQVGL